MFMDSCSLGTVVTVLALSKHDAIVTSIQNNYSKNFKSIIFIVFISVLTPDFVD